MKCVYKIRGTVIDKRIGFRRAWYIGCALGFQPREEISIISVRSKFIAGVAYWLGIGPPVRRTEFDSPPPHQAGVAQAEERRIRNAEAGVSITPSGSNFIARPMRPRCGQVNRCHAGLISHESGVQLASPQPEWESRSTGGSPACTRQMRVQLPPLPPS